jgi:hypothetical protein
MSNLFIYIYSGGKGSEVHETFKEGGRGISYKSLGISALYIYAYSMYKPLFIYDLYSRLCFILTQPTL